MKPEGNKVGNCTGWNAKPLGPIGNEEEAKAESCGGILLESAGGLRTCKARKPESGRNL
jgi:hypothetical protein